MELLFVTFEQVLILFVMVLLGWMMAKAGLISAERKEGLSVVLMDLVLPAVILDSLQQMDRSDAPMLVKTLLLCILVHVLLILFSTLFFRKGRSKDPQIDRICTTFTNAGFMGIPLLTALFGNTGTFCAAVYVCVFHLFFWTYGVMILSGSSNPKSALRQLCSPTILAMLVSAFLFLFNIRLPHVLLSPASYLSDMNSPLAMIVTGASLAGYDLPLMFRKKRVYYLSAVRLIVFPLVLFLIFRAFGFTDMVGMSVLAAGACPTGALVPILARRYRHDEETASAVFAMTTVCSAISLPIYMLVIQSFS